MPHRCWWSGLCWCPKLETGNKKGPKLGGLGSSNDLQYTLAKANGRSSPDDDVRFDDLSSGHELAITPFRLHTSAARQLG
jgi:hypothetical protein